MTDEDIPTDPVIREAWERMQSSFLDAANFLSREKAFLSRKMTPIEQVVFFALWEREAWSGITIKSQHQIGRYTVDFLVSTAGGEQIVVECDGHDFHERTKEQAQHDKRRDRELQTLGFKVYRFTGSEIWKTRGRCVTDALNLN